MSKRLRTESLSSNATPNDSQRYAAQASERALRTLKYASLEPEDTAPSLYMECLLPPHKPLSFTNYAGYESHYNQVHTNRCSECKSNFPSSHFLDLHIAENHDPIRASKQAAGEKMYVCFVEGCDKVCRDWKKRRSHLVDKHGYPKNYDFLIIDHGIDGRRSMLRAGIDSDGHRKSSRERQKADSPVSESTQATEATSIDEQTATPGASRQGATITNDGVSSDLKGDRDFDVVDDLASTMSALTMVPRSITFGKKGRAGFAKR